MGERRCVMLGIRRMQVPYSKQGLDALQKTLEIHAQLSRPFMFMEPTTGTLRVKTTTSLSEEGMEEEE